MKITIDEGVVEALLRALGENGKDVPRTKTEIAEKINSVIMDAVYDLNHSDDAQDESSLEEYTENENEDGEARDLTQIIRHW